MSFLMALQCFFDGNTAIESTLCSERRANHTVHCLTPGIWTWEVLDRSCMIIPQCPPDTCCRSICLRVLACKDCVSSVRICTTQAVSATCLALHVLCWEFSSIFTVSCSRNVHSSTFLGFPVSSCLTACPVTHPWKVVICCQNWWKSSGTEADGTSSVTQKFQFHSLNWCVGHQSPT